jgi:hypothetical protein
VPARDGGRLLRRRVRGIGFPRPLIVDLDGAW